MGVLSDLASYLGKLIVDNRAAIQNWITSNRILSAVILLSVANSALIAQYYYPVIRLSYLNPSVDGSWPDAVVCRWVEPGTGAGSPTRLVFFLTALDAGRVGGNKVIYTLSGNGGFDYNGTHFYVPHFLWFRQTSDQHTLVKPAELGVVPPLSHEYYYQRGFLDGSKNGGNGDIDCGGTTIEDIVDKGNGMFFARRRH
ncbi:hypothetical protein [Bradyrhizobium sp. SZCCHNS3002]|uniref:hypothetical protein n=1 Tax=Bradyrhizobium sp. SZCCHNS3002 TaxID=3057310 RepID=UPI0028F10FA4|nr:hypothetical protein [Bradyrhizobium sp. SZCCHNS3002]